MTREEKIEAIRTVYGDEVVEGCEEWDYRLPKDGFPPEWMDDKIEYWNDTSAEWQNIATYESLLRRYPREVEKTKCIVEDVPVEWVKGEMVVNNRTVMPFIGNDDICHAGRDDWQIAEFLFEERLSLSLFPIVHHNSAYIRANSVRLVRWE